MNLKRVFFLFLILTHAKVFCQDHSIVTPQLNDDYSNFIIKIEKAVSHIDYKLFRESLIKSDQYQIIINNKHIMDSLGFLMFTAAKDAQYDKVIFMANAILSIDYTNMMAHKMLSQAYNSKADSINGTKHATIKKGLLNSIIKNGDGNSCLTAWPIVQVTEEGFMLKEIGGEIIDMEINKESLCDKFTVASKEGKRVYFFKRINAIVK